MPPGPRGFASPFLPRAFNRATRLWSVDRRVGCADLRRYRVDGPEPRAAVYFPERRGYICQNVARLWSYATEQRPGRDPGLRPPTNAAINAR
jgi:hypothetical protein